MGRTVGIHTAHHKNAAPFFAKEDRALVVYSHDIASEPSKIGMRMEWLGKILATAEGNHVAVKGFGEF